MTDTVVPLLASGDLPERIEEYLGLAHWTALEREIREGLPVGMTAYGGTPLFELILSAQENAPRGNQPLPMSLLDALIEHGLARGVIEGDRGMTAVSLAAEYGQWAWMRRLVEEDYLVETAQWPVLCAIAFGRNNRFHSWIEHFERVDELEDVELSSIPLQDKVVSLHPASSSRPSPFDRAWDKLVQETPAMRDAVLRLVATGVDVDACPANLLPDPSLVPEGAHRGGSALLAAIDNDDLEFARAMVDAGATLGVIYAAWNGENSAALLTPLGSAIRAGWTSLVRSMLTAGDAMVPVPYTEAGTIGTMHPLCMLVSLNDDIDRTDMIELLASFMTAEEVQREGLHGMQQAAFSNRVPYLRALHEQGVPYNAATRNGFQPIHQACAQGAEGAIEFLLANGAKLTDTSHTGVSAASLLLDKPDLARKFNATEQADNVRMFRRRR